MNNNGATGIVAAIMLGGIILIAGAAASVMMGNTNEGLEEYEQILNEALDEISNYIQIKDIVGKYYSMEREKRIQKIAILVKPLFSIDVDTSEFIIKLTNGEQIKMLYNNGQTEYIHSNSLFEHPLWNDMRESEFSFIAILDKDRSLIDYNIINDNTDMAYIIIKLPEEFTMKKGDTMTITLFPSTGVTRTTTVKAPLPLQSIVSLV
ncbi:MAG: hypothetical protein KAQ84_00155 [Thermoplasmatales archaeon]|nr:hypothetical protein [Thermoplasmatales archaeon]MCK5261030.1 hypothetical protein [Thermoplasmatales archaeon]